MDILIEIEKSKKIQETIQQNKKNRLENYFIKSQKEKFILYVTECIINTIINLDKLKETIITSIPFSNITLFFNISNDNIIDLIEYTRTYFENHQISVEIKNNFPMPSSVDYKLKL